MKRSSIRLAAASALSIACIAAPIITAPAFAASSSNIVRGWVEVDPGSSARPSSIALDGVDDVAYVTNKVTDSVSVIDTVSNTVVDTIGAGPTGIGEAPVDVAHDPIAKKAYVVNSRSHSVSVVDTGTRTVLSVIPPGPLGIGAHPQAIDVDPGRQRAYVASWTDGTVSVIDTATDRVISVIRHDSATGVGSNPVDVVVDRTLHRAYVTNMRDNTVSVIDTITDEVVSVIPHGSTGIGYSPRTAAVDEIGHRVFVANYGSGSVSVIDARTNTVTAVLTDQIRPTATTVAVDITGNQLWVGSEGGGKGPSITAIDLTTLKTVRTFSPVGLNGYSVGAGAMAVDPESRRAYAVVSPAGAVALLDLDSTRSLSRISGPDRFSGAANLSASEYTSPAEVAYVASGADFPDALSGSAAAGLEGGPVLLVTRSTIPDPVRAELLRSKPKRIVVLGGTTAIDETVATGLAAYAPVSRLSGADRFAVSAAVSASLFPSSKPPVAYIASGEKFPDALSVGAVAARAGGPILLVRRDRITESVASELSRLAPRSIVVLGGPEAVSATVATALTEIAPTTRISGADRFAVSAEISAHTFTSGADVAYVASGVAFPDALAGGPVATRNEGPVLLIRPDSVPAAIGEELRRLAPRRVVVLGGPKAVSPEVFEQLRSFVE